LDATQSKQLQYITTEEFRSIIANIVVRVGINNLPSEPEFLMLYDTTKNYFPYNTIGEFILAIELNEIGLYWERVNAYNLLSIKFISDIGKQYNEYKRKMVVELQKKKAVVSNDKLLSESSVVVNYNEMLDRDVDLLNKGKKVIVELVAVFMMDALVKKGAFTDDLFTDEQWTKMTTEAKAIVNRERKESMLRIDKEKMTATEFRDYKQSIINERKRIIYTKILSSPQMLEQVKNKLN